MFLGPVCFAGFEQIIAQPLFEWSWEPRVLACLSRVL